jgi:hypothetical protein
MKPCGFVTMGVPSGRLGRVIHKTANCLKIRWSEITTINQREAKNLKKCKHCWSDTAQAIKEEKV